MENMLPFDFVSEKTGFPLTCSDFVHDNIQLVPLIRMFDEAISGIEEGQPQLSNVYKKYDDLIGALYTYNITHDSSHDIHEVVVTYGTNEDVWTWEDWHDNCIDMPRLFRRDEEEEEKDYMIDRSLHELEKW